MTPYLWPHEGEWSFSHYRCEEYQNIDLTITGFLQLCFHLNSLAFLPHSHSVKFLLYFLGKLLPNLAGHPFSPWIYMSRRKWDPTETMTYVFNCYHGILLHYSCDCHDNWFYLEIEFLYNCNFITGKCCWTSSATTPVKLWLLLLVNSIKPSYNLP